ncbi:XisI protein [Candidatus Poribacteria bacterium]|nr:XisI protein [Candidatus Poribacteria bacterium]
MIFGGLLATVKQRLLSEFSAWANRTPSPNHETICVFDEERDHYVLLNVAWAQYRCVRSAQVFVRLRNGKIWVEEDWTENGIATDLLEEGVPKDDIVLAFHPLERRPFTEFAVA